MRKRIRSAVLAACIMGLPATQARASCWSEAAVAAAHVRSMDSMLMVAALRCRGSGVDVMARYNGFVRSNRATLANVNDNLRGHFASDGGLNAYDHFVTSMANRYGGGIAGMSCGDMDSLLSEAIEAKGSMPLLSELAQSTIVVPELPGGRCVITARR